METATRYQRRVNGLPQKAKPDSLPKKILTSGWLWATILLTVLYAVLLYAQYDLFTAPREYEGGTIPGISKGSIKWAAQLAWPTLAVWTAIFLLIDRLRPLRLLLWYLALGWGAAVATWTSVYINTWAAEKLSIQGDNDPAAGARSAIYIAPFVEEAMKATVLFGIAILIRYRFVSRLSGIVLGCLSAVGFAFTENIIYYSRVINYVSGRAETGDMDAAIQQIVLLRGFMTSFGHPLFTAFTGIGLGIAIRTQSKTVRILAPLAGYLTACFLHMVFNTTASLFPENQQLMLYFLVALPLVFGMAYFVYRQLKRTRLTIQERLTDLVRMGWLAETDPVAASKVFTRARAVTIALSRGWRPVRATWALHRSLSELAFLRDAEVRGIVDQTAQVRTRELLDNINAWRPLGIVDPTGMKIVWPKFSAIRWPWAKKNRVAAVPSGPTYSAVDPGWAPPTSG